MARVGFCKNVENVEGVERRLLDWFVGQKSTLSQPNNLRFLRSTTSTSYSERQQPTHNHRFPTV